MKGPIVSIDVSNGKSDYQAFKNLNVKYTGGTTSRKSTSQTEISLLIQLLFT